MSTSTDTLSPEQITELGYLLSAAVEGGIGYWSVCDFYDWADDIPADKRGVTIVEIPDDDEVDLPRRVTLADLWDAARRVVDGNFWTDVPDYATPGPATRRACAALIFSNGQDDPDFDASSADVVFQVAVFGRVIFG